MAGFDPAALVQAAAGTARARALPAPVRRAPVALSRPRPTLTPLSVVQAREARTQAQRDAKPRGLWDQIGDTFTNIIPGLVSLGGLAAKSATAPIRAAIDYAQGDASLAEAAAPVLSPLNPFGIALAAPKDVQAKYLPLQTQVAESAQRTGGNLIHPSRYGKAIREGRIVDTVLEDVGNLSLVGAGAGKLLGAGARAAEAAGNIGRAETLGRAATGFERAGALGGKINDLPISIPRRGLQLAGSGVVKGIERLAGGEGVLSEAAQGLRTRYPLILTPEGRALNEARKTTARAAARRATAPTRALYDEVMKSGITTAEQGATTAIRTGIADVYDNLVRSGIDPAEAQQIIATRDIAEQTFTPEVAAVLDARREGTLTPEQQARIGSYGTVVDDQVRQVTDRALAGEGRPGGPLDPRQMGDEILQDRVEQAVAEAGYTMDNVPPEVLASIQANPLMYASRWRPAMRAAGLANQALAERGLPALASTPEQMLAAGMESPGYLPGGRSDIVSPLSVGTGRAPVREGLSGVKGIGSEKLRSSAEVQPFSARTLGEKLGKEASRTTLNAGLMEMIQNPELRAVGDIIPDDVRAGLRERAQREAAAMRGTDAQMAAEEARLYGELVTEELKNRGYEPLAGNREAPEVGDFDPNSKVSFNDIGDDTVVLPQGLKGRLIPHSVGKDMGRLAQALERVNRRFKGAVLPFSLRWQLGDVVGGAFMSAVGGGIPPWELIDGMRNIRKLDDAGIEAVLKRPEFQDAGLNFEESRWMNETPDTPGPRTPIGKFQRKSFQINASLNRLNRQGYLLAKLQRLLEDKGLTLDGVQAGGAWDDPAVQEAIVAAVDDANKVMGTFDEMTPFERRVVRNVFPFWAWNRHITQLAFRTAIDNPARMLWTLRLGSYGTDPEVDLPSWLKGSIPAGDWLVPTNFINPFNDVGGGSIYTPGGAIKALSPGLRLPLYGLGLDPSKGLSPVSRRYDGQGLDEMGREQSLRPDLSTLLYQTIRTFPLGRAALDIAPTDEIAGIGLGPHPRYQSGELMVNRRGLPIDTKSRWRSAAGLVGLPLPTPQAEVDQQLAAAAKRRAEARRRARHTVGYNG